MFIGKMTLHYRIVEKLLGPTIAANTLPSCKFHHNLLTIFYGFPPMSSKPHLVQKAYLVK